MWPVLAMPYEGHALNLLLATSVFHSGVQNSYSTTFSPLSQCSTCAPRTRMRVEFHCPAGWQTFLAGAMRL